MLIKIEDTTVIVPIKEYEELQNIKDNYDSLLQKNKECYNNSLEKIDKTFENFKRQMLHGEFSFVLEQLPYTDYFTYSVIPTERALENLNARRVEVKKLEEVPSEIKHSFFSRFKLW